ncbi:hypothetical protein F3Y22_tig00110377pilonHSYRG00054 [Hibiscus syriacus]|uniref:Reverse transcriptase zinc-binding domain-containing protein n=1 Tax=Hibiscus syriacus TaxID=106335 RepID=A0A6A3AXM3_HIBSY|nr:hypothetical protein F3Y22_tig00110377pilonHSYRG00054 [Hibiscus syriacus]
MRTLRSLHPVGRKPIVEDEEEHTDASATEKQPDGNPLISSTPTLQVPRTLDKGRDGKLVQFCGFRTAPVPIEAGMGGSRQVRHQWVVGVGMNLKMWVWGWGGDIRTRPFALDNGKSTFQHSMKAPKIKPAVPVRKPLTVVTNNMAVKLTLLLLLLVSRTLTGLILLGSREAFGYVGIILVTVDIMGCAASTKPGCAASTKPSSTFRDLILDFGLRNIDFHGPKFTWSRGAADACLDCFICNSHWDEAFPVSIVEHLLRIHSDHRPIFLEVGTHHHNYSAPTFRYISAWRMHNDFKRMVIPSESLSENINQFSIAISNWNKSIFGYIGSNKRSIMARLRGVQRALYVRQTHFLNTLEENLLIDLEALLDQEELLWKQKSQSDWIHLGDRNTTYFYKKVASRKQRNRVHALKLDDGNWFHDPATLKQDGSSISVWNYNWVSSAGPLRDHVVDPLAPERYPDFNDIMIDDGHWNHNLLQSILPGNIVSQITSIRCPLTGDTVDSCNWRWNDSFSISNSYTCLTNATWDTRSAHWKAVWRLPLLLRVKLFLWPALKEKLLTNAQRYRRSLTSNATCTLYRTAPETVLHTLRDCPHAKYVWSSILPGSNSLDFYNSSTHFVGAYGKIGKIVYLPIQETPLTPSSNAAPPGPVVIKPPDPLTFSKLPLLSTPLPFNDRRLP